MTKIQDKLFKASKEESRLTSTSPTKKKEGGQATVLGTNVASNYKLLEVKK